MEIHGPSGSGKTVLLCEIAGNVQKQGGQIKFKDPEARLNNEFSKLFGMKPDDMEYERPNTVTKAFNAIHKWEPEPDDGTTVHGVFADSLAALSTDLEMDNEDGDKMGARRAKEFSEQFRKLTRVLANRNILMVCSNQLRVNLGAGPYGPKITVPGGKAIEYYPSLRLRCSNSKKLKKTRTIRGVEVEKVIGVETEIEVFKSSIDQPFRTATLPIIYDYGIDDIRANLQFVKSYAKGGTYTVNGDSLGKSLDDAIKAVEEEKLEKRLREEVIELWKEVEEKFAEGSERRPRHE